MILSFVNRLILPSRVPATVLHISRRHKTHRRDGTVRPVPRVLPFGIFGVLATVVSGLFIGAAISKSMANFLEENDLFVPSDDDDDED